MFEETYTRGSVSFPMQVETEEGHPCDEWIAKVRATLDLLPDTHLALFTTRGSGYVRIGSRPRRGGAFGYVGQELRGGTVNRNFVRVSYDAMQERGYNQGRFLYTMLHETGHLVDHYQFVRGEEPAVSCMDLLRDEDPLGCLSILRRYHSGATRGPSEHFGDIYADYFYNEVGGERFNVHRREPHWRCTGGCGVWDAALTQELEAQGESLPRARDEVTDLRYTALFSTPIFAGVSRRGAETAATTSDDAATPSPSLEVREDETGARRMSRNPMANEDRDE